ncbi:AraC family transcriptional regulator [Chryseobacterium sp. W4I1]|uniref:helix-turn-helix domain-containing protein n=1 Tax=Chryseobacterium sp. W4I1 TaxID=3042293 RepID=UPI00278385E9|nr:helix-turn-helix domain-containing protein [Chryseobacterium sp. W4I1]MDQ0784484.1 AraC-like DNA-binding protein [Chryseobacterium sp. W4I1]
MTRFKYYIFFLFINLVSAQKNSINSLKEYTYTDLQQKFYEYGKIEKTNDAKNIAKYYLKRAKKEKNNDQIAEGYVLMHFNEDLPIALKYLDSLTVITKNSTKNTYPARIYLLKGNIFFNSDNQIKALENYNLGLKYAKEKENKRQIAIADISIANLNNYIGKHQDAIKTLRYYLHNADYLHESELQDIHLNLASTYQDIDQIDSANIMIKEGLLSSKNDDYLHNKYLSLFGLSSLKQKNYKVAIDSLNKSSNFFLTKHNDMALNYALMYLGQAYAGAGQKENAVKNFIKIDSIIQKTNNTFPELRDVYTYIIDYYKDKNEKEKQLYYIERFLKVDKILDSQLWVLSRELPKTYDTPNLIKEKETIIKDLEKKRVILYCSISILIAILILLAYLYFKSKKKEKEHRRIAQELIQKAYEGQPVADHQEDPLIEIPQEQVKDKNVSIISQDLTQAILKELEIFETKEHFLNKGITLGSLAKKIKTNSKYLSEIINTQKRKNFAGYLNDLRIDYAIARLAKDKKFRSYKFPVIAEELGYNNEQAFTLAFKKRTGIPLSFYLREIEKSEG